jgi:hypothetical protein
MGRPINNLLRRIDQEQRGRFEQDRRKAQAELAAIEESYALGERDNEIVRLHPNNSGRKRLSSPAGDVADKGRKWGGCLPGSFETGKRR